MNLAATTLTAQDAGKKGTTYTLTFEDGTKVAQTSKREYAAALVAITNEEHPSGAGQVAAIAFSGRPALAEKHQYRNWPVWEKTHVVTLTK